MTSEKEFWIASYLASVKSHFRNADRFLVNVEIVGASVESVGFRPLDVHKQPQSEDMQTVNAFQTASREGRKVRSQIIVREGFEQRLMAKIALALGNQILGVRFLDTEHAANLRKALREADLTKRMALPIRGIQYFSSADTSAISEVLSFPGAWVLLVQTLSDQLVFAVFTPAKTMMSIVVSEEPQLVAKAMSKYSSGLVWLTIPSLHRAVGPLSLPEYLAHQTKSLLCPELERISGKWIEFSSLTPC